MSLVPIAPGDHVTLGKPHPCGSYDWTVTRGGADVGLQCVKCGRRVMLEREEFERRTKRVIRAADLADSTGREAPC